MTEIFFHPEGKTAKIPSSWDEMTPKQVQFVFKTYEECIKKNLSPLEFNIRVLYYLIGIKSVSQYVKISCKDPEKARKISENTYYLCNSCLSFLFTEQENGEAPQLSYTPIRNSLPAVRSKIGPLLIGPADLLQDLTFGEFRHASAALNTFFKTHSIEDLNECIAYLYRRRSRKANNAGRYVRPIQAETFEKDVKLVAALPSWKKNIIMCFFSGCLHYLQNNSLDIDGETVDFAKLYSGGDSSSKIKFNWNDLLVQIARDNVIGNIEEVDQQPLFKIFAIMWTNHKENKANEANRKVK